MRPRSHWGVCSVANGEVDRAIRLHQGLVQRGDLTDQQRVQALLALGEDYMKSGLLDRAETVFTELAQLDQRAPQALRHLIGIYQAERDWEKAIDNATRYEQVTGEPMGKLISDSNANWLTAIVAWARPTMRCRRSHVPTRPMAPPCAPVFWKGASKPSAVTMKRRCAHSSVQPGTIRNTCRRSFLR